uniref:ribonuclease P n=1 Tax=Phaeomonas parva TaxID=124430 RepID=A0A7S1UFE7_9STRA|mmetsp:Transcript_4581/g.13058  ORF Transcript_4581/g.13058 Transcript_4581/m.13058 type:complete len:581 (+) Transcript_4581:97-1839(+)
MARRLLLLALSLLSGFAWRPTGPSRRLPPLRATPPGVDDARHRSLVRQTQDALRAEPGPERDQLIRRALNCGLRMRDPYSLTIYSNFLLPCNTKLKKKEYHALLNLCATPELAEVGKRILNDMVSAGHRLDEPSFLFFVRTSARMGNPLEAFGVVNRMSEGNVTIRLRTYKPILEELELIGDFDNYCRVWDHMETSSGVAAGEEQVAQALRMIRDFGLWEPRHADWLEEKLGDFSRRHLSLGNDTLALLAEAVANPGPKPLDPNPKSKKLEPGPSEPEPEPKTRLKGRAVGFEPDPNEHECPVCGAEIPRRRLGAAERDDLVQGLFGIAEETDREAGIQNLRFFQGWIGKHTTPERGGPYDVIIDAANVAYTRPLLPPATINNTMVAPPLAFKFTQIQAVVDWCKGAGLRPLVVLSAKYGEETFTTGVLKRGGSSARRARLASKQNLQRLTKPDKAILKKWEEDDILFRVNRGGNDDWYWILAAVSQSDGHDTLFISNDQMRDHRLRLMHARAFARWQANTQIAYNFQMTGDGEETELSIFEPPVWSREIHQTGPRRWHIPGPGDEWACVELPVREGEEA